MEHITGEKTEDGRRAKETFIPKPKGGRTRAYRLPLSDSMAAILDRLRVYSTEEWAFAGSPWCSRANIKRELDHVKGFKEQRRAVLVNPHSLRRTFATVAADVVPAKHYFVLDESRSAEDHNRCLHLNAPRVLASKSASDHRYGAAAVGVAVTRHLGIAPQRNGTDLRPTASLGPEGTTIVQKTRQIDRDYSYRG